MRRAALATLVLAGACGDPALERLAQIRREVCACTTVACAEAALAKLPSRNVTSDHRTQAHARSMMNCLAKLAEAPEAGEEAGSGAGD